MMAERFHHAIELRSWKPISGGEINVEKSHPFKVISMRRRIALRCPTSFQLQRSTRQRGSL